MAIIGRLEIEKQIYSVIADLITNKKINISGGLYFPDTRPHDSRKEDTIVVVSTATAEQIQEGRVKVNIYVADLTSGQRKVPNIARLRQIEKYDSVILDALNKSLTEYHCWFSAVTDYYAEAETGEHFININIGFKRTTF